MFPKNNSRVNNCGKRILVDEVPAKLTDPNFNVILVGHRDKDEAPATGRRRSSRRGYLASMKLAH